MSEGRSPMVEISFVVFFFLVFSYLLFGVDAGAGEKYYICFDELYGTSYLIRFGVSRPIKKQNRKTNTKLQYTRENRR